MSYDINLVRGDTGDILVTVLINGNPSFPFDLTDVTEITFNIKNNTNPALPPLISKLMSTGDITKLIPMTDGKYNVHLTDANTKLLNQLRSYWIDSRITDPSGIFTVINAVTDTTPQLAQG